MFCNKQANLLLVLPFFLFGLICAPVLGMPNNHQLCLELALKAAPVEQDEIALFFAPLKNNGEGFLELLKFDLATAQQAASPSSISHEAFDKAVRTAIYNHSGAHYPELEGKLARYLWIEMRLRRGRSFDSLLIRRAIRAGIRGDELEQQAQAHVEAPQSSLLPILGQYQAFPEDKNLSAHIPSEVITLLDHPKVSNPSKDAVVLFHPEEGEFNGAVGYEHVKDKLAFTWSSHGLPGKAVLLRDPKKKEEFYQLTPTQVLLILMAHPRFGQANTIFANSCFSGLSNGNHPALASEMARLSKRLVLGWNGSVVTRNINGKNYMWVEFRGRIVPLDQAMTVFYPDGTSRLVDRPESLFDKVQLVDRIPSQQH